MIIANRTPGEFTSILNSGEQVQWTGRPVTLPFLSSGLLFLVFGLIWGAIDYGFINVFMGRRGGMPSEMLTILVPFFLLHTAPCWLSVLNILRLALVAQKTWYGFTGQRLLMKGGMWGSSLRTIAYEEITALEVTVNPIESMFGVGTIKIDTGRTRTGRNGTYPVYDTFSAIQNPYEVYKQLSGAYAAAKDPVDSSSAL